MFIPFADQEESAWEERGFYNSKEEARGKGTGEAEWYSSVLEASSTKSLLCGKTCTSARVVGLANEFSQSGRLLTCQDGKCSPHDHTYRQIERGFSYMV
jgi:hypothetical protein